ncbi:hypothetical protein [Streptomyces dysideae]|uniref:LigA protein n=1 Tax=Streptomyces dysideae TaxID=909626 RepID=A0A117S1Y7_9ACTN|nr:hypothetical protein [Streptomyces dysideae]KUO21891.1 hypothetical protein AQJ91_07095 [Streptomyces dysideae]
MPVEHDEDRFEGRLSHALRQAGSDFDTDQGALVAAGRARGRRLWLRRRAAVMGGAAGVAVVGVGGALLVPWGGTPAPSPSSVASKPSPTPTPSEPTPISDAALIRTLEVLLPEGEFSGRQGRGVSDKSGPYAQVVFDDGEGPAAVSIAMGRVEPGSDQARQVVECPDKVYTPHDSCETSRLADGSVLKLFKGYEYPDRRVDTKLWTSDLVTPKGQHIHVSEWNSAAEKDQPISRPRPPLSSAQLTELVSADVWRRVVDAIPEDPKKPSAEPVPDRDPEPVGGSVPATLTTLLPKGLNVVGKGGEGEFGYLVVDDGKGQTLVQVNVQSGMGDVEKQLFGEDSETLPDGTKVTTRQGPGEKGGQGVVMWTADTLRTDGTRVVISAFNTGSQNAAATRETPALTIAQLRDIALDPKWLI